MSLVEDLKAEAAKLIAEAEALAKAAEQKVVGAVEGEAHNAVAGTEAEVKAEVAAVETKVEQAATVAVADVAVEAAKVAAKTAPKQGEVVVRGTRYAADGLTIEWKG